LSVGFDEAVRDHEHDWTEPLEIEDYEEAMTEEAYRVFVKTVPLSKFDKFSNAVGWMYSNGCQCLGCNMRDD